MNPNPNAVLHPNFLPVKKTESRRGILFYGLIWVVFMLPNTYWTAVPFVIGHTNLSELGLILLPLVYRLYPKRKARWHSRSLQTTIIIFWLACFIGVFIQFIFEKANPVTLIKTNRIMLPLFACTALLFLGARLSSRRILYHFLGAISCSFFLGLLASAVGFQFSGFGGASLEEGAFDVGQHGRLYNVNSSFSYFAIAITATLVSAKKSLIVADSQYPRFVFWAIAMSLIGGVLTFNRTFLGIGALFLLVSSMMILKPKVVAVALGLILIGGATGYLAYTNNGEIKKQVDRRIIRPFTEDRLSEQLFHEGRRVGYRIYQEQLLKTSRGVTGVAPGIVGYPTRDGYYNVNSADISFVTVWWRFGAFALMMWFVLFFVLAKQLVAHRRQSKSTFFKSHASSLLIGMTLLALASLNIDVLARHYTIVHLGVLVIALRDN
jgi:hypothetical protein